VNVYFDAVLHPRAAKDEKVFLQEGWHYEVENADAPLNIKGVVYNEMKGVYGDPAALLGRTVQQSLFPQNAYGK
jgi:Zn-dependent M16 (insulinase) family peptidase